MTDLLIYFHQRLDAQKAEWALGGGFTVTQPRMAEQPYLSRAWVIEVKVPDGTLSNIPGTRDMGTIQAIVNRYDGEIHQEAS